MCTGRENPVEQLILTESAVESIGKLINKGLQVGIIQSVICATNKGFHVRYNDMQPLQMLRIFIRIVNDTFMIIAVLV